MATVKQASKSYARDRGISHQEVLDAIREGKLEAVEEDGFFFVIFDPELSSRTPTSIQRSDPSLEAPAESRAATQIGAKTSEKLVVKSDYRTTRIIVFMVSLIAWILVVAGVFMLLSAGAILIGSKESVENDVAQFLISGLAVGPVAVGGAVLFVFGLSLVMFSQLTRAALDSADYARESLLLAKQRAV